MENSYWGHWYFGWGWFLWFGVWFLLITSAGHWGYSYRAHKKYLRQWHRSPQDILNERYARGEISNDEYAQMKISLGQ
jgi:putative membrane protein